MQREMELKVVRTDITKLALHAIVNAANEGLLGGAGVDGAIHAAAGPELLQACRQISEVAPGVRCPTGLARITPGFALPARFVIHTVGPVWRGGDQGEPELLASCYRSALWLAQAYGLESIAFPAISCGVYGYPLPPACERAVHSVRQFADTATRGLPSGQATIREVQFVAFDDAVARALQHALRQ